MQVSWQHTSGRLQSLVGYTLSKSFDDSSGYGEQINPINHRLSRGLSAFDSTNNFVASYSYTLPIDKLSGPKRLTNGWIISGITKFATGLTCDDGRNRRSIVARDWFRWADHAAGGHADILWGRWIKRIREIAGGQYFNPAAFGPSALGTEGDARRRYFHGPGINNWDFALLKEHDDH